MRDATVSVPVRIHDHVVSHAHEPALELCNESVYCVVSLHEANVAVDIACVCRVSGALASWVRRTDDHASGVDLTNVLYHTITRNQARAARCMTS